MSLSQDTFNFLEDSEQVKAEKAETNLFASPLALTCVSIVLCLNGNLVIRTHMFLHFKQFFQPQTSCLLC